MKKLIRKLILLLVVHISLFSVGCNISFQKQPDKYYNVYYYCDDVLISTENIKENSIIPEIDQELIIVKEGYKFIGWDINDDNEVDKMPIVTSEIILRAVYREDRKYHVSFYLDDKMIDSREYDLNCDVSSFDEQEKKSDEKYQYEFIGWDCNNDGIAEEFPFKVTSDLTFIALFEKTLNKYNYKMYDGDLLVQEGNIDYGTKVVYNGPTYKVVEGIPYGLVGWDVDEDGLVDDVSSIKNDLVLKAVYSDTQLLIMEVDNKVYVKYLLPGQRLDLLVLQLESAQRLVWYIDNNYQNILDTNMMPKGNFYLYGKIEESFSIDTSLLEFTPLSTVTSKDDLILMFDYCLLNRIYNQKIVLDFNFNIDTLLDEIVEASQIDVTYKVSSSYNPNKKELELSFSYQNINTTGSTIIYEQYDAYGLMEYPKTRGDNFNDFYIDKVKNTYNVSNSEQLYYCLERGFRPIINEDNHELLNLYDKMKNVLREIIDDSMSDYDKALAIYEWMIMEVTYDKYVFDLVANNQSVSQYHCFYLEGVFNEKLAVCDGISKAYAALANIEGIPCVRVTGKGNVNHAWNKICINNNWYVVDATSGGTIINREFEILTHSFFLVTDEYFSKFYQEDGKYFNGIEAIGEFNYYSKYGYNYKNKNNDFSCENIQEITDILDWFSSLCKTKSTCEMYINFDYGDDILDELQTAQSNSSIKGISYIFENNVLIILKK